MALEFFTSQQGFNKGISDLPSTVGANNNVATNKNKINAFKTERSASDNAQNKKQFAEFMDSLKKKQDSNNDKDVAKNTDKADKTQNAAPKEKPESIATFQTQQSAVNFVALTEEGKTSPSDTLSLLSEKLQLLIDEEINKAEKPSDDLIQIIKGNDETGDDKALRSLLASLINVIKGENNANSNQTTNEENSLGDDPLLTVLGGLTPQEITDLKVQINDFLTDELSDENKEALASLVSQFFPLTQPEAKAEKPVSDNAKTISDNILKTDLQADKTAQNQNSDQQGQGKDSKYDSRYDARYDNAQPRSNSGEDNGKNFETALKEIGGKDLGNTAPTPQNTSPDKSAGQRFLQISSTLPPLTAGIDGQLQQGGLTATSQTLPLQSALTNVTTQAPSATQTHPATQLISMTIQKAIKSGDDTNIKLRLDPPDLGRVEVKMSIDKDNKTRIVLTAEKPETYLMLQRDSQALQQALSNAGLDNGADLSFKMASEDHDFNQQNNGNNSGKNSNSTDEDEQILQNTMDWYVNPETGRMHYNIVV